VRAHVRGPKILGTLIPTLAGGAADPLEIKNTLLPTRVIVSKFRRCKSNRLGAPGLPQKFGRTLGPTPLGRGG